MRSFWNSLPKPFFCLAPMANVTDAAFRRIIAKHSRLKERGDVALWTEFVSADGLFRVKGGVAPPGEHGTGFDALIGDLAFTESERPIVAQFFTNTPELMARAASLAEELGFDGVDINIGCPDRNVCKQGAGAALIQTPKLAQELVHAAQEATKLPVSVKTRTGYNTNELDTWIPALLKTHPAAIIIHARTKKEMSKVPARWDDIARAVSLRDKVGNDTLIVGNGDVIDMADARAKQKESGCDGVMLGRAIFGNPWLLGEKPRPPLSERLKVLKEHVLLFDELFLGKKSFAVMKKHFKSYVAGNDGSKELVQKLMDTERAEEAISIIDEHIA